MPSSRKSVFLCPFPASPRRQPRAFSPFCKESGHSAQGCWLLKISSSASFDPGERPARRPPADSFPPHSAIAPPPALAPAQCASCLRSPEPVGGWVGGQVAQLPRLEASREEAGR